MNLKLFPNYWLLLTNNYWGKYSNYLIQLFFGNWVQVLSLLIPTGLINFNPSSNLGSCVGKYIKVHNYLIIV